MDRLLRVSIISVLALASCAPSPSGGPSRSVAELSAVIGSGHLFARRAAIAELCRAAPVTPAELELLTSAALQNRRLRLRGAALAAIGNTRAPNPRLIAGCLGLIELPDPAVARAGLELCLRLGVAAGDPRLARARLSLPSAFPEDPAVRIARLEFRAKADRAEKALALIDPKDIFAAAEEAQRATSHEALIALLDHPAFRAGGMEAGRLVARAGTPVLKRAVELACSEDLMDRDVGLGIIFHMKDPSAGEELRKLAQGKDKGAECARAALAEPGGKR